MRRAFIVPSATFQKVLRGEASLNEYIGLEPSELTAAATLAANLYEQGRIAEARAMFEGLTALDRRFYLGYAGLGVIELIEGHLELALRNLTCAAELNPGDASVQSNLGQVLLKCSEYAKARRCFERAIALDPRCEDPGANRARAILQGLPQEAGLTDGGPVRGR
jgi:tetratricopeptide (TPR) repeat protein